MSKKNNIRSQYIKDLMADKESLSEQLAKTTKDSLRALLEDTVNEQLRGILNEADDKDFEEDEVNTDATTDVTVDANPEDSTETVDTESSETETDGDDTVTDVTDDIETTDGEGMWDDLEQYKGEDDEYDLTGMGSEDVIKVFKAMGPEDNVRVVKNDNGTLTLSDDETEKEYVIDIEGTMENGGDDEVDVVNEEDLGYTDNYQNKTAMTTPSNNEPGKHVRTWDKGIPTGTEKPWVGNKGDMAPFDKEVNECGNCGKNPCECNEDETIYELDIPEGDETPVEENTSVAGGARVKGMVGDSNHSKEAAQRHSHKSGDGAHKENLTNESREMANFRRKAESIFNENKQLREIAKQLKEEIERAVVINNSLAKVINLVTENATTRNEKLNILERFNQVKTREESNALYETISKELQGAHNVNNTSNLINNQITEAKNSDKKNQVVETSMMKSESLNETIDFMKRLNAIK